jgi:uncharacterized membrane protein (DUF485 family)
MPHLVEWLELAAIVGGYLVAACVLVGCAAFFAAWLVGAIYSF